MFRLIKLIIWILVLSAGIFWWQYQSFINGGGCIDWVGKNGDGYFYVEKGENFYSTLKKHPHYNHPVFLKIYLKQNPPDFKLQVGKYTTDCSSDIVDFLDFFRKPLSEGDENITFLEGWNIYDIDKTLTKKGFTKAGDFVTFVSDKNNISSIAKNYNFVIAAETLEGFLYPDTYAINGSNFEIEGLVKKMLSNFELKVIKSGIVSSTKSTEIIEILNLTSIVQKEANKRDNPEELALIAGILKKRAAEGWQIGADATVCYAYEIATEDCSPSEVLKYLYDKNEYNTRQKIGLPRGPIANPEAEVIEATINSKTSPYYYYLHDTTGQIHYGVTNADHEANKAKYLN